jgi:hypothetical protein
MAAGLSSAPQMEAIQRPCLVGPEKETVSTPRCLASAPAVSWVPVTRLNTPGGKSAASNASARMKADSEVAAAGLSTIVQPAASAGASWLNASMIG